jgi:aminopeptidase N
MLRRKLGDEAFFSGIRSYYDSFKFSNALTKDLQTALEKASDQSLDAFFQQWVFKPGHPKLECVYEWKAKKGKLRFSIAQKQTTGAMTFPLNVAFELVNGEVITKRFEIAAEQSSFWVELPAEPRKILLDPGTDLLFQGKVSAKEAK